MILIGVEQWSVRVDKSRGEQIRRDLLRKGLLDLKLRIRADGDRLLLPVLSPVEGAGRDLFEPLEDRETPPRHELIGGIAIMQERDRAGARKLLISRPSLHTVLHPVSAVNGRHRVRHFEVLAGEETTMTTVTEYGRRFQIDLEHAYFSPRLAEERQRLLAAARAGECVLDMFAGVGPLSITLAEKARIVYATDINPEAVRLMVRNIRMNKAWNVVPLLADAMHLGFFGPCRFDRIVMNLPMSSPLFIDIARKLCRGGGTIHFYVLQSSDGEFMPFIRERGFRIAGERRVRSYSPGKWHAVYDIICPGEMEEGVNRGVP